MGRDELKHLALLVSSDIHRYKQHKVRLPKEEYIEHHLMLIGILVELKSMIQRKDK